MEYVVLTRFEDWAEPVDRQSHLLPGEYACFKITEVDELKTFAADAHSRGELGNSSWLLTLRVPDDAVLKRQENAEIINRLMKPFEWWISVEILEEFWENWDQLDMREQHETVSSTNVLQVPITHVVKFVQYALSGDVAVETVRGDEHKAQIPEFFRQFAALVKGCSIKEVDQLVWGYLMHPCWVISARFDTRVERDLCVDTIRSMIHPFRDYLAKLEPDVQGGQNGFFMWFDLWDSSDLWRSFPDEFLAVITEVLYLPSAACQAAALHGFNHLDHPDRATAIDTWANSKVADPSLLEFAKMCRAGEYQ